MKHRSCHPVSPAALAACETVAEAIYAQVMPCWFCGSSDGLLTLWAAPGEPVESRCAECTSIVWVPVR